MIAIHNKYKSARNCLLPALITIPLLGCNGDGNNDSSASTFDLKVDCSVAAMQAVAPEGNIVQSASIMAATDNTNEFCAVTAHYMSPGLEGEADSQVNYFIKLPTKNWNGKLLFQGGGGLVGGTDYGTWDNRNYAIAHTDTGHTRDFMASFNVPAWALEESGDLYMTRIVDFAHRAVHLSTVNTKAFLTASYDQDIQRSYFYGGSTGGRQALVAANRYPDDYDGIIAAYPALEYDGLMMSFAHNMQLQLRGSDYYLSQDKLALIRNGVLAACDGNDGLTDGIVSDPESCSFNPDVLLCSDDSDGSECLTPGQIDTYRGILQGPRTSAGESIYKGPEAVSIADQTGDWPTWIAPAASPIQQEDLSYNFAVQSQPIQALFADVYMKYLFFSTPDASRDYRYFDFDADPAFRTLLGDQMNAHANIEAFRAKGGKLIIYHGWSDAVVYPQRTIDYLNDVANYTGGTGSTDEFARLFMIPGYGHGSLISNAPTVKNHTQIDAERDWILALDQWVEEGIAPEHILATTENDSGEVILERPLCPYPQKAVYDGSGDASLAESFSCQ